MEKNVAVGIAVVCVAAAAVFGFASRKKQADSLTPVVTVVDAAASASVTSGEGGLLDQALAFGGADAQADMSDAGGVNPLAGIYLGDGGAVPPLPDKSPKSVRCGIILFRSARAR